MAIHYSNWQRAYQLWKTFDARHRQDTTEGQFINAVRRLGSDALRRVQPRNGFSMVELAGSIQNAIELPVEEAVWAAAGSPYYRVHPQMIARLGRTNLAAIPARMLEMPDNRTHCVVNFPYDAPQLLRFNEGPLDDSYVLSLFCVRTQDNLSVRMKTKYTEAYRQQHNNKRASEFEVAVGGYTVWTLDVQRDTSIADTIARTIRNSEQLTGQTLTDIQLAIEQVLSVLVSVGFLKNSSPELFEYDVTARHLDEYRIATPARRLEIEEIARRAGKIGWNCGTDAMFVEPHEAQPTIPGQEGSAMQWAHIRRGHPHAVRYGPGRSQVRIQWFRSTTVRPDLPFKPE